MSFLPAYRNRYNELSGATYGTEFTPGSRSTRPLHPTIPLDLVPSTDTNGHGTFLAGIAAGGSLPRNISSWHRSGMRTRDRQAKTCQTLSPRFLPCQQDADAYQENDIMMGIKYLRVTAFRLGRPLIILIALGSNLGSHEGTSPLSSVMLQDTSRSWAGQRSSQPAMDRPGPSPFGHHSRQERLVLMWRSRVGQPESPRGFVPGAVGIHYRHLLCGLCLPQRRDNLPYSYYSQERNLYPFSSGTHGHYRELPAD